MEFIGVPIFFSTVEMLSLCHTLKEVKAFQNQAEAPLVFLLTFWAMSFLMILYTFWHIELFTFFWEPGGHHFLAEVNFAATMPQKED